MMSLLRCRMRGNHTDGNEHCARFHQKLTIIDKWDVAGMDTHLSNEELISTFLKTIPKDCKNSKLVITKGIIKGDRSWFPI